MQSNVLALRDVLLFQPPRVAGSVCSLPSIQETLEAVRECRFEALVPY